MPRQKIPLLNVDRQSLTTNVGSHIANITVWQQVSDGYWYASIEAPVGTPLASGRRINLDEPVIGQNPTLDGDFFCRSLSSLHNEPTDEPWDNTHVLLYEYD